MKLKSVKREEARKRAEARAKRLPHEQFRLLSDRPGDSIKEHQRIYSAAFPGPDEDDQQRRGTDHA